MNTHRETILSMIVSTISAIAVAPVFRSRREAFDRKELPAIVVMPGAEQNERFSSHRVKRVFQILIEVHAAENTAAGLTADQVADALIAPLHQALFLDKTFGGILADFVDKEMQEPQFADGDETRVGITLVYEAYYATNEKTITTLTNH